MPLTDMSEEFGRQALVVGGEGQAKLRRARVAVVGAGGGGSHVIQQLAYLGVGEILVIDPDVYEESNRHRVVLATHSDLGKPKMKIVERFIRKIGLGCRIQSPVAEACISVRTDNIDFPILAHIKRTPDSRQALSMRVLHVD